jgi:WD40 repeat protein/serine/threonine protein kinase
MPTTRTEESIFAEALEKSTPAERAEFLAAACGDNPELHARVEKLLKSHEAAGSFLRQSPTALMPTAGYEPIVERPGSVIGPYKLMELVGEGGMGLVFVAEQQAPVRRKVALKIIKPGMDTREVIARFEAERQALALMEHPNIARVFDAGTTASGRPYFVMELVKGIPLVEYCDQQQLTAHERLTLLLAVCQAVQHAHGKGIIHRDLKPSNILVSPHDGVPVVKVIDFGVAKAIGQQLTEKTIYTRFTQMIGTPLYMSPEQAEINALDVDTRSDIYSLGVLLYELLTGTTPFDRERFATAAFDEIRRIIREEEPPKPSTRLSTLGATLATVSQRRKMEPRKLSALVRGDLDWIVMKALDKDRARRYETASALAADLRRFLIEQPVEARPPSTLYRLQKLARRHRRTAVIAAFLSVLVGAMLVNHFVGYFRLKEARGRAAAEFNRARAAAAEARDERDRAVAAAAERDALAETERQLRRDAQWQTVHLLFEQGHARCVHEDAASGMAALADTLQEASRLGAADLEQATRLQMGAWRREVFPLRAILAHEDAILDGVRAVAFSPDGRQFVTAYASRDGGENGWAGGKVQRWDASTATSFGPPLAHRGPVLAVAFSPDGGTIAAGCELHEEGTIQGEVRFWDAGTGVEKSSSIRPGGAVMALAFSSDGKKLLTATRLQSGRGEGRIWDMETLQPLGSPVPHRVGVEAACFSPDGRLFALAGVEPHVWQVDAASEAKFVLSKHAKIHTAVTFRPDGKTILSAGLDTTALLWDADTGGLLGPLLRHPTGFRSAAFSRDGRTILTACRDRTARLWDAATGLPLGPPLRHQGGVNAAAISPHGTIVVTVSEDRTARVWDVAAEWLPAPVAATRIWETADTLPTPKRVMLKQHGKGEMRLASDGRVWGVLSWEQAEGPVNLAGPDGKLLSSSMSWGQALGIVAAFSPDGTLLLTANMHTLAKAQVWETVTGKARGPMLDTMLGQPCAAFSPDNKYLFIGSDGDNRAGMIWEVETGKMAGPVLKRQDHFGNGVQAAVFSPNGQAILTAGGNSVAQLWEVGTWRPLGPRLDVSASYQAAAFHPDGRSVVLASDSQARRWEVETWKPLTPPLLHHDNVTVVAISSDGKLILTGSKDQTVQLWDATTGKPVGPALVHDAEVAAAAFSHDCQIIATGSKDLTVRLWDAATGKALGSPQLTAGGWITALAFGPRNETLYTGTPAFVWQAPRSVPGDVERIRAWIGVLTGLELDENRALRVLDGTTWRERKQRLQQLGGQPAP